jgi:hypothetical protein
MSWLRGWRRANSPGNEERRSLENWVRLRFHLASSSPMTAIIGAFGRLTPAPRGLPVRATHAVKHPYHRTVPAKVSVGPELPRHCHRRFDVR